MDESDIDIMPSAETINVSFEHLGVLGFGEGKISTEISIEAAMAQADLARPHLVKVDSDQAVTCMDDRPSVGQSNGNEYVPRLGMAGGNALTGYFGITMAEAKMSAVYEGATHQDKLIDFTDRMSEHDERAGVHKSTDASPENCGCGACMELIRALQLVDEHSEDIGSILDAASGGLDELTMNLHRANTEVAGVIADDLIASGWKGTELVDAVQVKDPDAVEVLQSAEDEVHGHHADIVLLIDIDSVALNKKSYSEDEGLMAFQVNLPKIREIAGKYGQSEAEVTRIYLAEMAFQLGVTAALTNGSLHFIRVTES